MSLAVVPLKLVATAERTRYGFERIELRADGTMFLDGDPWAKMFPDRVEDLAPGGAGPKRPLFRIGADGVLTADNGRTARLTADTLASAGGERFTVGDDGTVAFTDGRGTTTPIPARFASMTPEGKPAALVVIATTRIGFIPLFQPEGP